jgi:hypothetical protein
MAAQLTKNQPPANPARFKRQSSSVGARRAIEHSPAHRRRGKIHH